MAWTIITDYTSKCAQMDPQQLRKTSIFCSRSKKRDIEKPLWGWVPPPLVARRFKLGDHFNISLLAFHVVTRSFIHKKQNKILDVLPILLGRERQFFLS